MAFSHQEFERFTAEREALFRRYCAADIHEAESVLIAIEDLVRSQGHNAWSPEAVKFDLAFLLARRSEIRFRLGDDQQGRALMSEALLLLHQCPQADDFVSLTPGAILELLGKIDGPLRVTWKRADA